MELESFSILIIFFVDKKRIKIDFIYWNKRKLFKMDDDNKKKKKKLNARYKNERVICENKTVSSRVLREKIKNFIFNLILKAKLILNYLSC